MKTIIRCIGFLLLTIPAARAQESPQVRGRFEADSISIGEVVPYSLTVRYPRAEQVLFPDSTFAFKPFEIRAKKFFTTKTKGDISYDSAVYFLTTFEIDGIQRLKLPVFIQQAKDCVTFFSKNDSLFLRFRVATVPDSVSAEKLPLKTNTAYQNVKWILNYPVYALIAMIFIVAGVVTWITFGSRIRKYFILRRLQRDYREFISRFSRALDKLASEFTSRRAEETLVVWKSYMEDLEKNPYTKFTSREIIRLVSDSKLDNALRSIDRGIYGGLLPSLDPFRFLQSYSYERFQKKEAEVRNG